ncbi:tetratricopeptide repeat protein [Actinoplanes sp. NPDC048796]|uniref:tetratricopeptide repeat protein n=1 Tax=unclassified Actinoplanes TaxID=2626549 RepID=UPI0033D37209
MEAIDQLGDDNPAAAQLLCVCAVLHPAPLPVDVLTPGLPTLPRPLGEVTPSALPAVVETLTTQGLAATDAGGLTIPDQIRDAVRDNLGPEAVRVCRAYAGTLIAAAAPTEVENPSTWPRWAALAPHLIAADAAHSPDPALRTAAHRLVASLLHRGKPRPARTIAAELHAAWSAELGPDHPDTLTAAHELARSMLAAGALLPARALLEDTLNRMIQALGPTHPQTLSTAATRRGALLRLGGAPGKTAQRRPRRR